MTSKSISNICTTGVAQSYKNLSGHLRTGRKLPKEFMLALQKRDGKHKFVGIQDHKNRFSAGVDSLIPLMHHSIRDLGLVLLVWVIPKKRNQITDGPCWEKIKSTMGKSKSQNFILACPSLKKLLAVKVM